MLLITEEWIGLQCDRVDSGVRWSVSVVMYTSLGSVLL
jgi:hypothetical protein